eukprot:Gb_18239 [translate_table: standard]
MDQVAKVEPGYEEMGNSVRAMPFSGNSETEGDRHGLEALATLKLESDGFNDEGSKDAAFGDASKLYLQKGRSLAFGYSIYKGTKGQGKDSGTDLLIPYHNYRLRCVLAELISQHRWKESTGVLSVLLTGSVRDNYFFRHQCKYWAAMEVLRQVEGVQGNAMRFKRIYGLLKNKQPAPKRSINKKLRPAVQLEMALHLISQGDHQGALDATKLLMQESQFRDDPVANMVQGLILHQHWYNSVVEELQLTQHGFNTPSQGMEVDSLDDSSESSESVEDLHPHVPRESNKNEDLMMLDSDSSIGNAKEFPKDSGDYSLRKRHNGCSGQGTLKHRVRGFYEVSDEEVSSSHEGGISQAMAVRCSSDLDRGLFPIQLPRTHEHVKYIIPMQRKNTRDFRLDALKYFQIAISSSPPIFAALLPFLQLLLANGQVKKAWKELEKFCRNSNHLLPFSLRARLAESLSPKNSLLLARCYEEILQKNPASGHSIKRLVKLHKKGDYETESLVEYIGLHLDATYGSANIWSELASCFLKIQAECQLEHEKDRISTEHDMNNSDAGHEYFTLANQFPRMFLKSEIRSTWKLRCRWWASRHFSNKQQEIGDRKHITFKAACACHILGPKFGYVHEIYVLLEKEEEDNMLSILKSHIQHSLRLREHL